MFWSIASEAPRKRCLFLYPRLRREAKPLLGGTPPSHLLMALSIPVTAVVPPTVVVFLLVVGCCGCIAGIAARLKPTFV